MKMLREEKKKIPNWPNYLRARSGWSVVVRLAITPQPGNAFPLAARLSCEKLRFRPDEQSRRRMEKMGRGRDGRIKESGEFARNMAGRGKYLPDNFV